MRKINFGVWGFGRMGAEHGKFYAMEKDTFKLVAACDTDPKRRERAKADYQCAVYADSEKFLADPDMELVVISTLSLDHTRHTVQALESGKMVLLDKPIAITDEELETLRRADKEHPKKLFVLHNLRFEPMFEAVQKAIAQGLLGEINLIKLRRHLRGHYFRSDWQTLLEYGGGLLNNWGNHEIDHAVQLLGSHAVDVWSQLWHVSAGGTGDDHMKIILKGDNNRVADLEISYSVALPEPYCTVYGQRGTLVASENEVHVRYIDPEFDIPKVSIETDTAAYSNRMEKNIPWMEKTVKVESAGMWEYIDRKLINHLYDAVVKGIPSPIKNSDAFETIRIIQEVKKQNPKFDWIM